MIRIGPAGSGGRGNLKGVAEVARLGLGCMEVAFTYGVRMMLDEARQVGKLAREKGVVLSVHAPYYINLASDESDKLAASKKRILDSCRCAHAMGAVNVVFHAGFYQQETASQTYRRICRELMELQRCIGEQNWNVRLCPETTGKPSQFGSLKELLRLMDETGCGITVDFSHLYARHKGKIDWHDLLERLPGRLHTHFSGITFGDKGEKKHVPVTPSFFRPLALAFVQQKPDITVICESPRPFEDAVLMKRVIGGLKKTSRRRQALRRRQNR